MFRSFYLILQLILARSNININKLHHNVCVGYTMTWRLVRDLHQRGLKVRG